MKTAVIHLIFTPLFLFNAIAFAHNDGGIQIKEAWIREAPPNAKVLAAYMTIENHTKTKKTLTTIKSSSFARIEIHETIEKDGMASMQQRQTLEIASQGSVTLAPNGLHFMLFDSNQALKAGDKVQFTLIFKNGSRSIVSLEVKKATGGHEHHDHGGMDHGGMDHGNKNHEQHSEHNMPNHSQEHHSH